VMGALFNTVFGEVTDARCDLPALARQHASAVVAGLAPPTSQEP